MASPDLLHELNSLKLEYEDYQAQSKELELALEQELEEKDRKLEELSSKYNKSSQDLENLKKKYQQIEAETVRYQLEIEKMKKIIRSFEREKKELENLNDQWEKSARILEYSKQNLEEKLYQAEENAIMYKEELEELSNTKNEEVQRLREKCDELKQELISIELSPPPVDRKARSPTPNLKHTLETVITIPIPAAKSGSRNPSREVSRKGSFEEVAAKQSVKVLVFFRPPSTAESWDKSTLQIDSGQVVVKEKKDVKNFEFEKVFPPCSPQPDLFHEVQDSIENLAVGGNACIMAYGQTGSGKTYTMNYLINASLDALCSQLSEDYKITIQCIEVYNEQLKNLLNDDPLSKNWKEVLAKSEFKLGAEWKDEALGLIKKAISRRTTKFTECNERSSRSHAIISFNIIGPNTSGKVQFVDLAGSERIGKSLVAGEELKEALNINKSLSALQDVVSALETKQKHIPYRNSMLTQVLQPTLGGSDSSVTMIMNCSPESESLPETVCTLALGSRVKAVDLGFFIRKNLGNKEVERTLTLLEKERSEKNSLLRMLDKIQRDLEYKSIALKDKDCKINSLQAKLKGNERDGLRKNTHIITKKGKKYEELEIRVGSLSPLSFYNPVSPLNTQGSRIPTLVNLKINKQKK